MREIGQAVGPRPMLPKPLFKFLQKHNISQIKAHGNRAGVAKKLDHSAPIKTVLDICGSGEKRISGSLNVNNLVTIKSNVGTYIKAGVLNCRSLKNKTASIVDHLIESDLDILALT